MDLQEFIRSGLLESYALGQCSSAETKTVETMLAAHAEARRELDAIENALQQYAAAAAVPPPAWMKGRILNQIEQASEAAPKTPSGKQGLAIKPLLGWALALVSALLMFQTWRASNENQRQQTQLEQTEQQLRDCDARERARQNLQAQIALLTNPATQTIEIKWLDAAARSEARALVYANSTTRQTYLGLAQLPALSAEQDYQLWVVVQGNPDPVPMEVFSPQADASALRQMTFHENFQAFAVSIEPKGGSQNGQPTTVVMLGKAG